MKKADQKIVLENPGATPHQLLLKGLSEAAFDEIVAVQTNTAQNTLQANRIEVEKPEQKLKPQVPSNIIRPIVNTSAIPSNLNATTGKMRIRAKGAGGSGTLVSLESAKRMLRRGGYEQC